MKILREEGWEVTGYFFNPNIHPYQEYLRRLEAMKEYGEMSDIKIIYPNEYEMEGFLRQVVFREGQRCQICYHLRLEATVKTAKEGEFDSFTTTLLYSVHQDHELIKTIGDSLGKKVGVPFLYRDFRTGWKVGIDISKSLKLYRQSYCGCIYSEKERYLSSKPVKTKMN